MGELEDYRVFVGGLSWDTTDKRLEQAFRRVGKVLDAKIMLERDTGRPRGFGFVTFADEQSMEDAIAEFHNRELDGRIISVNKAQPKMMGRGDFGYNDAYDNDDDRGGYSRGRGGPPPGAGREDCFRCGKPGHWARECPLNAEGGGFPPRYNGGRSDRFFGGGPPYSGGRYGDRYRGMDRGRERYGNDRFGSDRYGDSFAREDRGGYGRGGMDRYGGGGPARYDRSFRDRPGPYDRPSGRPYGGRY